MDMNCNTWEWVPHRVLRECWNEVNPADAVMIDDAEYNEGGWCIECSGKKKTDYGKWFRGRTVEEQIKQLEKEHESDVVNNVRHLSFLKRKCANLKLVAWAKRWLAKPLEPVEEVGEVEEEIEPEPIGLTSEETEMAETLRAINKNRSNVLWSNHKKAVSTLK